MTKRLAALPGKLSFVARFFHKIFDGVGTCFQGQFFGPCWGRSQMGERVASGMGRIGGGGGLENLSAEAKNVIPPYSKIRTNFGVFNKPDAVLS